ncbi:hypothetical protein NN3_63530 [Nocardia neocaledoniensis NBRC 108232]|uniref:Uncharacterized protein n=1 Tax=Nocardia neocaledoniensis TaxID=236511 RepID=A0A317NZI2_9NOCA|nr:MULTISPECIES: hypothetical protein [Nocardia]PWV79378.1 hypothetical protein DFR69_102441 [Nocardia neocaledoniensis]UGT57448.1 hypothetical protein LTT85_11665 [Nocardia asteroides]GEM35346.1 hypothetical protein NN3_63530 [Nocardia neocaledoniensis NBRC 108232]
MNRRTRRRGPRYTPRPSVAERLEAAEHLLSGSVSDAGGVWSRAVAWILRLALEQAVDELWAQIAPELMRCPMRAQLLALRVYAGPETAGQVGAVWAALSRAAHHLDYEMAPSVTDLRRWRDQTAELARALELVPLAHQPFA